MPIFATGPAAVVVEMYQAIGFGSPLYSSMQRDLADIGPNGQGLVAWADRLFDDFSRNYPTNADWAQAVLNNLLGNYPANTPTLRSQLTSLLNAAPADRGAILYLLADALTRLEGDPVFGTAARAFNLRVGEAYNQAMDPDQYIPKEGPGLPSVHGVQTLALTEGADTLNGGTYDDTFLVHPGTLGPSDVLSGGGGDDWLMYRSYGGAESAAVIQGFHTTGIATLLVNMRVYPGNGTPIDVSGMVGLAHVISEGSGSNVELLNVGSVVDLTLSQVFAGNTIIHYTPAALAASNDHMGITLYGIGTFFPSPPGPIGTIQADGISTFDVQASSADVGEIKSNTLLHMNVTGAYDLTLHALNFQGNLPTAPNTLDAHTMTGRLDVTLSTANAGSAATLVQGGSNVDTLRFTGKLADYTMHLGATITDTTTLHDSRADPLAANGRDYSVTGVERLVFTDQAMALDMGANQADGRVAMLLAALFGADVLHDTLLVGKVLGLTGQYDNSVSPWYSVSGLAGRLLNSDAYYTAPAVVAAGGYLDDAHLVSVVYSNVYGHAPDAATQAALVAPLANHSASQAGWLASLVMAAPEQLQTVLTGYAHGLMYMDQTYPYPF